MNYPTLNRPINETINSVTNTRTYRDERKHSFNELMRERMSITSFTKLLSGNNKEDKQENDSKKNNRYSFTISLNREMHRSSDKLLISKRKQKAQNNLRENHGCSDSNFILKEQQERKQKRKENHRSSDTCIPMNRKSFGNMFNYAINTIKNNISKEILDEYEDDHYNHYNNDEFEKVKVEDTEALRDFRNKMIKEGLVTNVAIREFLRQEKINAELLKRDNQSNQGKEESICSRFINTITARQEPHKKSKNCGFDVHETFLSRAMKQRILNEEDALYIRRSFRQRKVLRRLSCDKYLYDSMSSEWCKSNETIDDDDYSTDSDYLNYIMGIFEENNMGKRKNDTDDNDPCTIVHYEENGDGEAISSILYGDNEINISNEEQEKGYYYDNDIDSNFNKVTKSCIRERHYLLEV